MLRHSHIIHCLLSLLTPPLRITDVKSWCRVPEVLQVAGSFPHYTHTQCARTRRKGYLLRRLFVFLAPPPLPLQCVLPYVSNSSDYPLIVVALSPATTNIKNITNKSNPIVTSYGFYFHNSICQREKKKETHIHLLEK